MPLHKSFLRRHVLVASAVALGAMQMPAALAQDGEKPRLDVIYVQTPQAVVDRMLEMAEVKESDFVLDLGSGDGRMPITAAKRYRARGLGVDIDPARVKEAQESAREAGVTDMVEFRQGDLYQTELDPRVTVMTMYLLTRINMDLRPRILNQLPPGTRVVSHAFDMGEWRPDQSDKVDGRSVYFWVVPARIGGSWTMRDGNDEIRLDLTQQFQNVQGTARLNGRYVTLQNPRLRGTELSFTIETPSGETRRYVGRVDRNTIQGASAEGAREGWRAERAS